MIDLKEFKVKFHELDKFLETHQPEHEPVQDERDLLLKKNQEGEELLIKRAAYYIKTGNYEEALRDCSGILEQNRENQAASILRALAATKLNYPLLEIIKDGENAPDYPLEVSELFLSAAYDKILLENIEQEGLGELLEKGQNLRENPLFYLLRGISYRENINTNDFDSSHFYDQSLKDYEKALDFFHDKNEKGEILFRIAKIYYFRKNYQTALEKLNQTVDLRNAAKDYYLRGEIYTKTFQYEKARDDYINGIELSKAEGEPYSNYYQVLGFLCLNLGKPEEAKTFLKKAIESPDTSNNNSKAFMWLALMYLEENKLNKALKKIQQGINTDQSEIINYIVKGNILCRQEKYSEALNLYLRKIKELKKNDKDFDNDVSLFLTLITKLFIELKSEKKAINLIDQYLSDDYLSDDIEYRIKLTLNSYITNYPDYEGVEKFILRKINHQKMTDKNKLSFYFILCCISLNSKNYQKMKEQLAVWNKQYPNSFDLCLLNIFLLAEKKEYEKALKLLEKEKLNELDFNNDMIQILKYNILLELKRYEEIISDFPFSDNQIMLDVGGMRLILIKSLLGLKRYEDAYQHIEAYSKLEKNNYLISFASKLPSLYQLSIITKLADIWKICPFHFFFQLLNLCFRFQELRFYSPLFEDIILFLDDITQIPAEPKEGLLPLCRLIFGNDFSFSKLKKEFAKEGEEIFQIKKKQAILRFAIRKLNNETMYSNKIKQKEFQQMVELFLNLEESFEFELQNLIEKHEKSIADEKIRAKDEIIQSFSHKMKNTFPKAISSIENVLDEYEAKGELAPNELLASKKQLQRIEKIAHSINFSFKGNLEDLKWDISHHQDGKSLKKIVLHSLENGIENILDKSGIYADFAGRYFDLKTKKSVRNEFYSREKRDEKFYIDFLNRHFFKFEFEQGYSELYKLGNQRHTLTKFTEVIDELIFNGIKYSSSPVREERKFSIRFQEENDKVIFIAANQKASTANPLKTTGLGLGIVKNTLNSLNIPIFIEDSDHFYSVRIEFDNWWKQITD